MNCSFFYGRIISFYILSVYAARNSVWEKHFECQHVKIDNILIKILKLILPSVFPSFFYSSSPLQNSRWVHTWVIACCTLPTLLYRPGTAGEIFQENCIYYQNNHGIYFKNYIFSWTIVSCSHNKPLSLLLTFWQGRIWNVSIFFDCIFYCTLALNEYENFFATIIVRRAAWTIHTKRKISWLPGWKEALNNHPGERRVLRFSPRGSEAVRNQSGLLLCLFQVVSFILSHGRLHFSLW